MGGRRGYSLKKIVGDMRKVAHNKKELLQGIKENNPQKVVSESANILAKSDDVIESLAYSFLFVSSIKDKDTKKLRKEDTKERRKELAKRWADYRKTKKKRFDISTNRDIVDSATRILGSKKWVAPDKDN